MSFRKYDERTSSELAFNLSGKNFYRSTGNAIRLTYDTDEDDSLGVLSWFYRSPLRTKDGRSLLDLELGYGIGTQGSGIIASASTTLIPGLGLRLTYRQVGLTSDDSALSLGLFTSMLLQPNREISSNEQRIQKLRAQGGIFINPFLDKNNNGKQDKGEDSYTDDLELLFLVNNQPINRLGSKLDVMDNGAIFELPPDNYRLDLDSAGFPIGWKTENLAYAVKVAAGSYTKVPVPLIPSYVLAGQVTNGEGKPLGGLKVEAVSVDNPEKRFLSITNHGGIYYLEGLERTKYNLFIDGKPAQTNTFEINDDSDTFLELNLQKSDEVIVNR